MSDCVEKWKITQLSFEGILRQLDVFLKSRSQFLCNPVYILRGLCCKGPGAEVLDVGLGVVRHPYFFP